MSSSSPKEALLRASADRVAMRNKNLRYTCVKECIRKLCYFQIHVSFLIVVMPFMIHRGMSQSYSTQRDKNISKLAGYSSSDRRYEERNHDSPANEVSDLFSFIPLLATLKSLLKLTVQLSIF